MNCMPTRSQKTKAFVPVARFKPWKAAARANRSPYSTDLPRNETRTPCHFILRVDAGTPVGIGAVRTAPASSRPRAEEHSKASDCGNGSYGSCRTAVIGSLSTTRTSRTSMFRLLLETDDETRIYVQYHGVLVLSEAMRGALAGGTNHQLRRRLLREPAPLRDRRSQISLAESDRGRR